ncbi:MAG: lipopolysaccharide biosynthesis protein [Clostridia bacterium]|nr:lipopolysaccharide biosynthesis protein [Clostridia bacterium]
MEKSKESRVLKKPARASVWYLGTSVLCKGIGVVATPFLTRLQSEEAYGAFTLYVSLLGAMSVIVSAFTTGSSVYRGLDLYRDRKGALIKSVLVASLIFSALICIPLFAFSSFLGLSIYLVLLILIQLLCDVTVAVRLSMARFVYEYKEVAFISVAQSFFSVAIAIMILSTRGGGAEVRIYSMLLVSIVSALYAFFRITRNDGRISGEMVKYSITGSLSLLPHSISSALSGQADKLIFTAMLGTAALAKYSVVHSVGIGLSFVISALGSALGPWIIRRLNAGEGERIGEICELIFKGLAAATVFLIALAPEAIRILAPPEYSEALSAVLPISLSVLPSFLSSVATVILIHGERGRYTSYSSLSAVAVGILLNLLLIPRFSFNGAGAAMLASQTVGAWLSIKLMKKVGLRLLPTRKLIYYFSLTALLGIVMLSLYDYPAARILLLSIPAIWGLNSLFSAEKLVRE